jgi:UDP-N-acetylglucosamine acyltransferase
MSIDSSARIDPKAEIDSDVTIGPWTIVGPNVQIGSGTVIDSHVMIRANTKIGKDNRIFQFSSIGEDPADKKFEGEQTWLEIGDRNVLREAPICTVERTSVAVSLELVATTYSCPMCTSLMIAL